MIKESSGKRGRPLGFKLSDESKKAISESKKGQHHKEETKAKISRSLYIYFRHRNPLSEELINRYCKYDDDDSLCDWVISVKEELDNINDVITDRVLRNRGRIEVTYGHNIECFGHSFTPEFILLFKEYCELNDIDLKKFISEME
jgi:hypothetical protein